MTRTIAIIAAAASLIVLVIARFARIDADFRTIAYIIVTASGVFLAVYSLAIRRAQLDIVWGIVFIALAVLFNPIYEFRMSMSNWLLLRLIGAIVFGGYLLYLLVFRPSRRKRA